MSANYYKQVIGIIGSYTSSLSAVEIEMAKSNPAAFVRAHNKCNEVLYYLTLHDCGNNKIECIKLIRDITKLGLKEAKDVVDSVPSTIETPLSDKDSADMMSEFASYGAIVTRETKN